MGSRETSHCPCRHSEETKKRLAHFLLFFSVYRENSGLKCRLSGKLRRPLRYGTAISVAFDNLEVVFPTDDADMAGRGEQETQQTAIYGGQIRVLYRNDGIVIARKASRTSFEL